MELELVRLAAPTENTVWWQKLVGDLLDSEIARFLVVLPDPTESPFAFLIERLR
jgi:hypothetical protein